ncbi:MAG: flavoprotein, partial [Pirellulales bacterium]
MLLSPHSGEGPGRGKFANKAQISPLSMGDREILIGVTGGIAAYKTASLVSKLVQAGFGATVIMTRAATKFVGPATFEALSGRPVYSKVFGEPDKSLGSH